MEEIALFGFVIKIIYCFVAIVFLWGVVRFWNSLTRNKFDDTFEEILKDPKAAATYYGLRFLAFAVLVGLLIS